MGSTVRLLPAVAATLLVTALAAPGRLAGADDQPPVEATTPATVEDRVAPTVEYAKAKSELDDMLATRDVGLYEVDFQPLQLKRLVTKDRLGRFHAWHYLTFRVRNQAGGDRPVSQAEGYNAVLAGIVAQYEGTSIARGNGVALKVDGSDDRENTVVERSNAAPAHRRLSLTAIASDERGTRLTTLDKLTGSQAAETFDFPDLGDPSVGMADTWLRDKVEEAEGQHLLTTDEIRTHTLPSYDGTKPGEEPGWAAGELYGVFLFPQLSDLGTRWRIEVRGVSNQFREKFPEGQAGKDWLAAKIQRRVYVLDYAIPGDEYHRGENRFSLVKAGWEWVPSFQRYQRLLDRAWSEQALETLGNPETEPPADADDQAKAAFWKTYDQTEAAFWQTYEADRVARAASAHHLPDLKGETAR